MTDFIEVQLYETPLEISISNNGSNNVSVGFEDHGISIELNNDAQSQVVLQASGSYAIDLNIQQETEVVLADSEIHVIEVGIGSASTPAFYETGPEFFYSSGRLSSVVYDSGNTKTFSYVGDKLYQAEYNTSGGIHRKTFMYYPDGTLAEVIDNGV